MILNWNRDLWSLVWEGNDGPPPALLLAGPAGVGKSAFAQALAQAALCSARTPSNEACGTCHPCRLYLAAAHPDLRALEVTSVEDATGGDGAGATPSQAPRIIGVERIRELRDFTELSSHLGGRKVILINPADRLHPSAANALLKTLEEPPRGTLFVLVSARPQQLLPTLRSRCFRLDFRLPRETDALDWLRGEGIPEAETVLAHAGRAPLAAAELARSALWRRRQDISRLLASPHLTATELARAIDPDEMGSFGGLLYKWCADLLSLRLAGRVRYNLDYAKSLGQLAVNLDALTLQKLMKELTGVLRYLEHPLNQRLVCERMALGYTRALAAREQ
jgi:DNA polymerase-3 subunit delta'